MFCNHCGSKLEGTAAFCSNCGAPAGNTSPPTPPGYPTPPRPPAAPSSGGSAALRAIGILCIIFGPVIALVMGISRYLDVYSRTSSFFGSRDAERLALAALEQILPTLVLIGLLGVVVGIVLIVVGRKR